MGTHIPFVIISYYQNDSFVLIFNSRFRELHFFSNNIYIGKLDRSINTMFVTTT